jgi:hypothetical protein
LNRQTRRKATFSACARARQTFNRALEALMEDTTAQQRLSHANQHLAVLERYPDQIPGGCLAELRAVVDDFACAAKTAPDGLASEFENELTDRLFSLYVNVNSGALVF